MTVQFSAMSRFRAESLAWDEVRRQRTRKERERAGNSGHFSPPSKRGSVKRLTPQAPAGSRQAVFLSVLG
jgi:hypothetical protein